MFSLLCRFTHSLKGFPLTNWRSSISSVRNRCNCYSRDTIQRIQKRKWSVYQLDLPTSKDPTSVNTRFPIWDGLMGRVIAQRLYNELRQLIVCVHAKWTNSNRSMCMPRFTMAFCGFEFCWWNRLWGNWNLFPPPPTIQPLCTL